MKNYTLNLYLKIYLIILYLFAVFFFFQKYNNYVEWTISEWLINYQGGFTRRGLPGEIAFHIAQIFEFKLRFVILLMQIFFYNTFDANVATSLLSPFLNDTWPARANSLNFSTAWVRPLDVSLT